jgi:hypothetical protein
MRQRQGDYEPASGAEPAFHADGATVPVDDPLADGEADAGALVFFRAVEALKQAEDALVMLFVDPDPVVRHGELGTLAPVRGEDPAEGMK